MGENNEWGGKRREEREGVRKGGEGRKRCGKRGVESPSLNQLELQSAPPRRHDRHWNESHPWIPFPVNSWHYRHKNKRKDKNRSGLLNKRKGKKI